MTKRIDLTQFEGMFEGDHPKHLFEEVEKEFKDGGVRTTPLYLDQLYVNAITLLPELIAELKKMYAREDELLDALRIIRDDLNEGMAQGHLPIESTHGVSARKIRNFANDASQ